MKLAFITLDVFTSTRYAGNPLAIVLVKRSPTSSGSLLLSQFQKQAIAREFNLSETVFLYSGDEASTPLGLSVKIDIFTPSRELPFAGHPIIGVAWFILHCTPKAIQEPQFSYPSNSPIESTAVDPTLVPVGPTRVEKEAEGDIAAQVSILTKAGPIPVQQILSKSGFVEAQIPHDIHIHSHTLPTPPHLITSSSISSLPQLQPNQNPIISIVKGVSFILVRLPSLALLKKATASLVPDSRKAEGILDEEWNKGMVGTLFYADVGGEPSVNGQEEGIERKVGVNERREYRTRMWVEFEDAATGSASCALGAYLALQSNGQGGNRGEWAAAEEEMTTIHSYIFTQGVEMGQQSDIGVDVVMGKEGVVESVFLSGTAVKVMEGELEI